MSIGAHCIPHCKMLVEKGKAGYSLSAIIAHFLRACEHYLRMISSLVENESRVLPEMRKKGVAPRNKNMCAYIHLVRTCCPRSARGVLPLVAKNSTESAKFLRVGGSAQHINIHIYIYTYIHKYIYICICTCIRIFSKLEHTLNAEV